MNASRQLNIVARINNFLFLPMYSKIEFYLLIKFTKGSPITCQLLSVLCYCYLCARRVLPF